MLTSVGLAVYHFWDEHAGDQWAVPGTSISVYGVILVAAIPILWLYAMAKWREVHREVAEDEEEFRQNHTILESLIAKYGEEEVARLAPIPKAFRKLRYWFLRRLILWGEEVDGRPPVLRVANASLAFGVGLGSLITLLLAAVSIGLWIVEKRGLKVILKADVVDWLIVAIAVNAAFAAFLQWYSEKQALGEQYRQYKRTKMTFLLAHEALETKLDGQFAAPPAHVFKDLGRESLAEHADWLLLRRERPLELAWPPA